MIRRVMWWISVNILNERSLFPLNGSCPDTGERKLSGTYVFIYQTIRRHTQKVVVSVVLP